MANEIREDLMLTLKQFSLVAAAYYVTYGVMQIPVGILTEKFGTRLILTSACLICTVGVFWLVFADGFYPALISRLLIGFGSAFAFVALLILALNWFPKKYFGLLCGISLFLGAVGPLLAGAPLAYLSEHLEGNWRLILVWIGLLGSVLTLLIALFMRSTPKLERPEVIFITPHEPLRSKLAELLKNRQAWYVLLCAGFVYCPLPIFAAYFGTSYLQTRGFDKTTAALIVSMVWVGYAIGNPVIGRLSDQIKRRTPFLYLLSFLGCLVSVLILYFPSNHQLLLIFLFFLLGLASSVQGLAYALIVEHTPQKLHSAALGLNNTGCMLFGAIFPPIAGWMIQYTLRHSGRITLTAREYVGGLSMIPLLYAVAGMIALVLIKETYCRQQHEIHHLQPLHKASDLL
ncbi:MAG: putative sulfoacetate transporter SauU [Chlamydiales bacterium]|nr:putative sulfoacetate transporter SauU [Chlamydiales bacterium]